MNDTKPDNIEYLYGEITKVDEDKRLVEGFISSDQVDLGGHIIDPDYLKRTLPGWVADWGNVREMHDVHRAVGTVTELDLTKSVGPWVRTSVVDDAAWGKVKSGVYKGYSVGIKNPVIVRDSEAPKGRVVGGDLLEISLVDRPANPAARFTLFKAATSGSGLRDEQRGVVIDYEQPTPAPRTDDDFVKAAIIANNALQGDPKMLAGITELGLSAQVADLAKRDFSTAEREQLASEGKAESDGSYPIETVKDLKNAIKRWGTGGAKASDKAWIIKRAHALGATSELPDNWIGKTVTPEVTSALEPELAKARTVKAADTHPTHGVHNHTHVHSGTGTSHTHAHMHDEDDVHDHPHLNGKDARVLTPEERSEARDMQRTGSMYATATPDLTSATAPTVAKGAPDFNAPLQAQTLRPARDAEIDQLQMQLREIQSRMAVLAGQTDQDMDGDIDTSTTAAQPESNTKSPAADFAALTRTASLTPPKLGLSVADPDVAATPVADLGALVPDLAKSLSDMISTRITEEFARLRAELPVKTVEELAGVTADIAKRAQANAALTADLAGATTAFAQKMTDAQATAKRLEEELERVKRIAQPVKGQTAHVVPVEKTIGSEVYASTAPDVAAAAPRGMSFEELVSKARDLKDEGARKWLAGEIYRIQLDKQNAGR